ncbi:MAG TPA: glycoside hydrolase family 2 TIM barrel-domain containing protein [Armatimonadota bacterium]|nr:glycoside hydrolase family 2 TIM barrel-domain containing protein [Armatimonadota bacterium]
MGGCRLCAKVLLAMAALSGGGVSAAPVPVTLERPAAGWQLMREGAPYPVRGVAGEVHLGLAARIGANSIRTWGVSDSLPALLDEAAAHGLTVAVGLWLGHERHGFRYDEPQQVVGQLEACREAILRFRDHPAVLLWGIGNEMEAEGRNVAIWQHVNEIAAMAKELDPNHPTMTVISDCSEVKVRLLHEHCPSIDIVGMNSYGGAPTLPERYRAAGGTKPFIVTEYGPLGRWESPKTPWGAPIEATSTAKAEQYRRALEAQQASPELCLGSYAFLWGWKQEATPTWFGMLLPDGSRLAAADVLSEAWSGQPPANRCPAIASLVAETEAQLAPGDTFGASLAASDPEGDPLEAEWSVMAEPGAYGTGGDAEAVPPSLPETLVASSLTGAEARAPDQEGAYRLYVTVRDGQGGAATANLPFRVRVPGKIAAGRPAALPLVVYGDDAPGEPFAASGWMGDTTSLALDLECAETPAAGGTCLGVAFDKADGWAGVVWQDPPNDWGDAAGGYDLTGAHRLVWMARGAEGGERLKFGLGLLGEDKAFPDSARGEVEVTLTMGWQQFAIDLTGRELQCIKTGFYFVVVGQGVPVRFYVDDVRYE